MTLISSAFLRSKNVDILTNLECNLLNILREILSQKRVQK